LLVANGHAAPRRRAYRLGAMLSDVSEMSSEGGVVGRNQEPESWMTKRRAKPEKRHPFTQIPEFDKAMRILVKVPKEAIERAEQEEARKGKEH